MRKKRNKDDEPPEGGWMGPPPTTGLKALAELVYDKRRKKGIWVPIKQKRKDRELRREWERRMAKADKKGKWRFKWPPKDFQE